MPTKSVDTPLSEITIRRYEKPFQLTKREVMRKLCLSLGLLNPGDSRDVIVDVFFVLLEAGAKKELLDSEQIRERVIQCRKDHGLDDQGTAASNLRRQVRRLRELLLAEKVKNQYRINEFASLKEIFNEKLQKFFIPSITQRLAEYMEEADSQFKNDNAH